MRSHLRSVAKRKVSDFLLREEGMVGTTAALLQRRQWLVRPLWQWLCSLVRTPRPIFANRIAVLMSVVSTAGPANIVAARASGQMRFGLAKMIPTIAIVSQI